MILYFTGTGNSRYLAMFLSQLLKDECINSADYMKKNEAGLFKSEKPYVFVFPTYAYRMPHIFEDFIKRSHFEGSKKAYFIMSCGADTGNAIKYIKHLCQEKDMEFMGLEVVVMPDNYIVMYAGTSEKEVPAIIEKASYQIMKVSSTILEQKKRDDLSISIVDKIKSGKTNDLFYKFFVHADKFYATDACISCGICEQNCPLNNIKLVEGKPIWSDSCTHCLACICSCPKKAIEYGNGTKKRARYYLSKEQANELIKNYNKR